MTDLKTVLIQALNRSALSIYTLALPYRNVIRIQTTPASAPNHEEDFDADRVTKAIRDHLFDREKVRAALEAAFSHQQPLGHHGRAHHEGFEDDLDMDDLIDRLIEGLAGEVST